MVGGGQVRLRGTSPRTRGKQDDSQVCDLHARNIPAHAGKTVDENGNLESIQEHPRARGENNAVRIMVKTTSGTSPRTRGKPGTLRANLLLSRNIPAHAGKTAQAVAPIHGAIGTSPRTRGKLILTCGSSFLKVILHSVLFSHIMGV